MLDQLETLFPQVFRTAVVDQSELGAGEFRIGGHLHVQTRFRLLARQAVARHQLKIYKALWLPLQVKL